SPEMRACPLSVVRGSFLTAVCCLVGVVLPGNGQRPTDNGPLFILDTVSGERFRGPLAQLRDDWMARLGPPSRRSRNADAWLTLRRADLPLPSSPRETQLILTNGDRLPVAPASLQLAGEKLSFTSPLLAKKEAQLQVSAVAVLWLAA